MSTMNSRAMDYLGNISPEYLEQLIEQYVSAPHTLPLTWRLFFDGMELGKELSPAVDKANGYANGSQAPGAASASFSDYERRISSLIEGYRQRGHLAANLDPLGRPATGEPPRLELSRFELDKADAKMRFQSAKTLGLPPSTLAEILARLKNTYCGSIGVEYMHISDEKARSWLEKRMEPTANRTTFTADEKKQFLKDISEATLFEDFLQKSFTGQKRFSLEGAESLIPALKQIVRRIAEQGAKETVIGMAHRGRLNVLVNVMKKPLEDLFSEFFGAEFSSDFEGSGDVKYHMGFSSEVDVNGNSLHMSLGFNPSHLEAIDPVVQGMAKAKQNDKYGGDPNSIVPLLIHGDAAVIGQGVVCETLNYSGIDGYCTGGTLHIVINNQIGFTTMPEEARTSMYCTDFAKATQSPVLHVNGDDVEAVVHAVTLAADFRREFHRDVFVDIYSYRKYGHNEGDEPRFTQPDMYARIEKKQSTLQIYREQLLKEGVFNTTDIAALEARIFEKFETALNAVKEKPKSFHIEALGRNWGGLRAAGEKEMVQVSRFPVPTAELDQMIEVLHHVPATVKPLPKFVRMLETRLKKIQETGQVDWAVAEQLAYASLLKAGYSVRLSGQDCQRGTFSHRHYCFHDASGNGRHIPLKTFEGAANAINVYNSPLSEFGVLGFDFGYASSSPRTLTIWEAQFGDFANSAQVMIDQFIVATEAKWRRMNGIVLLLPHGYEGQGPEHSSARLERFLQLSGQGNIQVAYPTMPSQIYHLLRRQVLRDFRKPLVVMSPKSPLRMPEVVSNKEDLAAGQFENLLVTGAAPEKAERLVFCSGKVYWDLVKAAEEYKVSEKTAFARVEQLYPLDFARIKELQDQYKKVKNWVWCQEEPKNMGAWGYFRLATLDMGLPLHYAGRPTSASPATGSPKSHAQELQKLLESALKTN